MSDLRIICENAATLLIGQLAIIAFGITDTIVAGRYSVEALACLSVGSAIYISVYVSLMGIMQALLPIWSELFGAKKYEHLGHSFRQSVYLCVVTGILGITILLSPGSLLEATNVPEHLRSNVISYLSVLAAALPSALFFRIFSTLNQSIGKPHNVTNLQIGALALKVPLSIWFVHGGLGLEAQGVIGCAWATFVVNNALMILSFWTLKFIDLYRPLNLWKTFEKLDWLTLKGFLKLGVPAGISILIEVTSFTLMALFIARMGEVPMASHQISASIAAAFYMIPLSLAISASSRVSYWRGAGNEIKAIQSLMISLKITTLIGGVFALILVLSGNILAKAYSSDESVISLATSMLVWIALYHFADAIQTICVFLLRCYKITVRPLIIYGVLLWGLGLAGGYQIAYNPLGWELSWHSPSAFWLSSSFALCLTAIAFLMLLLNVSKKDTNSKIRPIQESLTL